MRYGRIGLRKTCVATCLVLALPSTALACSCVAEVGKRALPFAAAMFTGKATKVEFLAPDDRRTEPPILVTFEVSQVWKGPVRKVLSLRTTYNKWTCHGYYFQEGKTYLVTAQKVTAVRDGVELAGVDPCGGTRELAGASAIVDELGPGERPTNDSDSEPPH